MRGATIVFIPLIGNLKLGDNATDKDVEMWVQKHGWDITAVISNGEFYKEEE